MEVRGRRGAARMVPLDRVLLLTMPHAEKNCSQWLWPRLGRLYLPLLGFETAVQVKKTRMSREASNLGITAHERRYVAPTLTPQTPETPQEGVKGSHGPMGMERACAPIYGWAWASKNCPIPSGWTAAHLSDTSFVVSTVCRQGRSGN